MHESFRAQRPNTPLRDARSGCATKPWGESPLLRQFLEKATDERLPSSRLPEAPFELLSPGPGWEAHPQLLTIPGNVVGNLDLWGWSGQVRGESGAAGCLLRGFMRPLEILVDGKPFLSFDDGRASKGPLIELRAGAAYTGCFLSGRLGILDHQGASVLVSIETGGFCTRVSAVAATIYAGARLSYQHGRFTLGLSADLEHLATVTGIPGLELTGTVDFGHEHFRQTLVISAKRENQRRTARPLQWNHPIADWTELEAVIALVGESLS